MKLRRVDRPKARRLVPREPTSDRGFFGAALPLAFALFTLLTLFALGDVVGLPHLLPFFALPAVLFVVSALLAWRWATGETEAAPARRLVRRREESEAEDGDRWSA